MNSIQVVTFSSAQTLYGVMSIQIAGLYRDSGEPGSDGIVELVDFVEGAAAARHRTDNELVIRSHRGVRYRVPGPVELTEFRLDNFQLIPSLVSKYTEDRAIRVAFAYGDLIGLLVDLDMITVLA